jgi:uncharacterized protein (DUF58 family)
VITAVAVLALSSIMYRDLLIFATCLVLSVLVVFEAVWMVVVVRSPEKWFELHRGEASDHKEIRRILFPGDAAQDVLHFVKRVEGTVVLSSGLSFMSLSPSTIRGSPKVTAVRAEFKTPFAGEYRSERIGLDVIGPLRLLEQPCFLPASFDYSVYPRTLAVAQESMGILGKIEMGDFSIDLPGKGTEFYDVRRYQPGDSARRINWKSTAKHGELMVNEYMKEVSSSYYLVLEAVSPTYFDRDRLAATFLGLANALSTVRIRFGVLVHDGERVKGLARIDQPAVSLARAMKEALNFVEPSGTGPGEELSLWQGGLSTRAMKAFEERGIYTVSELVDMGHMQRRMSATNQGIAGTMKQLMEENLNVPPAVLYVSGMFGRLDTLLEAAWNVNRIYGARFIVANPTAPWVTARDDNEANELYLINQKRLDTLRSAGIEYHVGEPSSIIQRLISLRG